MVFSNLKITSSKNMISEASFIAVGSSVTAPYNDGDKIIIPFLDGICFSGVVNKTKKKQVSFNTTSQKTLWNINCLGDFKLLERERNTSITKYDEKTASYIIGQILGSDWSGNLEDSDTNPLKITYTISGSDKVTEMSEILSQTGYDWRCRREYYRCKVTGVTITSETEATIFTDTITLTTDELDGQTLVMISGNGKYISSGEVVGNSSDAIYLNNCINIDAEHINGEDVFVVTRHPVVDVSPTFDSGEVVKIFTVNEDIFNFDVDDDTTSRYNAIVVKGHDSIGNDYTSYLPAIYTVNSPGDWKDCTFIDDSISGSLPDARIDSIDWSTGYVTVDGASLGFTVGENVYINGTLHSVAALPASPAGKTILDFSAVDRGAYVGGYVLRKKIAVNDASKITGTSIIVGNEELTISSTSGNILTLASRSSSGSAHTTGTLVRSTGVYGKDGTTTVSETNPQEGSPVDSFGYLKIKTVNGSTNSNPALCDRLASTMIATGSLLTMTGVGTVPISKWYKSEISSDIGLTGSVLIEVGDVVQINNFGNTTGSTVLFKVTEYTIDFDRGVVDVKFGDRDIKEMNVISSLANTINRSL